METSKIKNILILILAVLNILLLAAVLSDRAESKASAREAFAAALEAVRASGIQVSGDVDEYVSTPSVYSVKRDLERERSKMESLLGGTGASDLGGNIWFYHAEKGQASLSGTGELDILFNAGAYERGDDPVKTAEKVLKKLGLEADTDSAVTSEDGEALTVELCCRWEGGRVYNVKMKFTFSGSELMMLSGTRLLDSAVDLGSESVMDMLTVMMRFVEAVGQEGYVCSELRGVDVGYLMSVAVSGESTLTPVWCFSTDAGDICINAVNGRIETVG